MLPLQELTNTFYYYHRMGASLPAFTLILGVLNALYLTAFASPTCSNSTVTPSRNTWALDYTGQLYSVYFCLTGSPSDLTWSFQDSSGTDIALFTFSTNFGSNPCQPVTPVPGYNATCQYINTGIPAGVVGCYTTAFSVTNRLASSFNQSTLQLTHGGSNCFAQNIWLQGCNPVNNSSLITSASSSPCGYQCQVEYSCAPNYSGDNVSAVCLADATFSATPNCGLIVCSNSALCSTTIPRYCYTKIGSTNVDTTVTIQCSTGYSGSVSATCGNDGSWTITTQSPCPALCPVSDITSSPGRCTNATGDILEGQSITVTCCNGYKGVSTMAICTSDRSWSNLPTCTKPVTCSLSNLSSISNNVLQSNNSTLSVNETKVISCAAEYNGSGATASCSDNGTLTLTDTNCTKTPTPDPEGKSLSDGAIAGIVIGCLIVVAIIIVVLIAIFCAEICCCTFSILCLSWGTKD